MIYGADDEQGAAQHFVGEVAIGDGLLITPTCDMADEGEQEVAHPFRTPMPVVPLGLVVEHAGALEQSENLLRSRDTIRPYMYLAGERVEAGVDPGDIAVLVDVNRKGKDATQALKGAGLEAEPLDRYEGEHADGILVGTLKRAKGLEFKEVLIPGLSAAEWPSRWLVPPGLPPEQREERIALQLRTLFVGMTRARDKLILLAGGKPADPLERAACSRCANTDPYAGVGSSSARSSGRPFGSSAIIRNALPGLHARDTRRVYDELVGLAERSIWLSTFAYFDGPKAFKTLANRMEQAPGLAVRLLLNIQRRQGETTASDELVVRFAERFWKKDWPGERLPAVFYDPRSLAAEGPTGVLHAKAVVADEEIALVTSANLAEAAFERNIEAGVLSRDRALAASLARHFRVLIERELLLPLPGG